MIKLLTNLGRTGLLCVALGAAAPAHAQSAWTTLDGEAAALLPRPERGSPFSGGRLACAGQVWTMTLATEPGAPVAGATGTAILSVPRGDFPAKSEAVAAGVEIVVPHAALEPMMASNWLTVSFEGGDTQTRITLAGSRRAITAVDGACTPREMPLFNSVALTPYSSYLELARQLRRQDIRDFVDSTATSPTLRAGMVEIDAERRLLFSELCGSTWYYGVSGCGLAGFAPVAGAAPEKPEGWRLVYESEGVFLYVDPRTSVGGWPVLVSLPRRAGDEETRWIWTGEAYAMQESVVAAPAEDGEGAGGD
jgi:hypothetical protein